MVDDPVTKHSDRVPTHPGTVLREDVFPALGVKIAGAAKDLGVSRQTLHRILAEEAPVTPAMALRLGKFCGNGPGLWLNMQSKYDLWHLERSMKVELERIPRRAA